MRQSWSTLLFALGALLLFALMFVRVGVLSPADLPRPTTEESGANGYLGAVAWLRAEGVRVEPLRERFSALGTQPHGGVAGLPASGNLLLVTLPAAVSFRSAELAPLDRWVRAGNTLLILAALADDPDWAVSGAGLAAGDLDLITGMSFRRLTLASTPARELIVPNGTHAYFQGVRALEPLSVRAHAAWAVKLPYDGFALELAHARSSGAGVLWLRPFGAGRIIVSGCASLFSNRALARADNAQLLANLVAASLGPHGAVLIDDMHQGLGAVYDPQKFYHDPRLYQTLLLLFAAWLLWILGARPLTLAPAPPVAVSELQLIAASGGFLARVLPSDAAARALTEHFLRSIAGPSGLPGAWQRLWAHPRLAHAEVAQLDAWYASARAGGRVPLVRLHRLIRHMQRELHR